MDTRTFCLAALLGRDSSGYKIKKRLDEPPFCHFQDTGFGSICPALTRLFSEGLIEVREQAQEKRPDKLVFSLTETGHRFVFDLGKSQYSNEHALLAENRQRMREEQDVDCTDLPGTGEAAALKRTQIPKGVQTL